MTIAELIAMPTTLDTGRARYHESLFRSYHILHGAIEWLDAGTPPAVTAALIRQMLEFPQTDLERKEN